jgi:hypothetical protein
VVRRVLATDWDHHEDYRKYVMSKQKPKGNPKFMEILTTVLKSRKYETRLIMNNDDIMKNVDRYSYVYIYIQIEHKI